MKSRRGWGVALALLFSLVLHLVLLAGPVWHLGGLFADGHDMLEARLVTPPVPKPKPKTPPVKKPARVPVESTPVQPVPGAVNNPAQDNAAPSPPAVPAAPVQTPSPVAEAAPEIAPPLPLKGRIQFGVYKGDQGERSFLVGRTVHEWQRDGKRYQLSATTETVGLAAMFRSVKIVQSSEGGFLQGELKPLAFRYDRGERDVATAAFDWAGRLVTLGDGQNVAIGEGAEDMLSMFYQLMQAAQRGEGFIMAVATGRKVERYAFEWLGEEVLKIKAGTFHAWHVRVRSASNAAGAAGDTTEVWLGREVAGLPVRIRYTDRKGEVGDQIAEEITYDGALTNNATK
ncbi:MAG: DUF3108 domain-containing protein [Rhodocyclaceae bacterium]|nr:MAG: DUF3108 domain-containing protein [Rhodocyclaceae bacterium]